MGLQLIPVVAGEGLVTSGSSPSLIFCDKVSGTTSHTEMYSSTSYPVQHKLKIQDLS